MKNYYKILGIKENASEEEIREHWVEWMRKLHPDQRIERGEEDERIKEINEAYQTLKHSSTRVEYDLKRAYDQRKRNSYLRRASIPVGILTVLIVGSTLYLKGIQMTIQPNQIDDPNVPNHLNQTNQINERDQINQKDQIDQTDQMNQGAIISNQRSVIIDQKNQIDASTHSRVSTSSHRRNDAKMPKLDEASYPKTQLPNDSITQLPNDPTSQRLNDQTTSIYETKQTDQPNQTKQKNEKDQRDQINPIDSSTPPRIHASTHPPTVSSTHEPVSVSSSQRPDASSHPPIHTSTPLIATEEEVKQFFANYAERYTQRDVDSFLSLFSSRAIQNRQQGLQEIRKLYDNFLKQSQEIQYGIDHIKIEIYENAVEVKARYELVQMMKKNRDQKVWRGDIRWSLIKEDGVLRILSLDYQHQKSP